MLLQGFKFILLARPRSSSACVHECEHMYVCVLLYSCEKYVQSEPVPEYWCMSVYYFIHVKKYVQSEPVPVYWCMSVYYFIHVKKYIYNQNYQYLRSGVCVCTTLFMWKICTIRTITCVLVYVCVLLYSREKIYTIRTSTCVVVYVCVLLYSCEKYVQSEPLPVYWCMCVYYFIHVKKYIQSEPVPA